MAAIAGHSARLEATGASTAMTTEATTNLGSDIYQITDASKRVIDPTQSITVADGGGTVSAANYTIDYLFGRIIFGVTPTGSVTITANYLPRIEFACARSASINLERTALDKTCFQPDASAGQAAVKRFMGLITASGDLEDISSPVATTFGSETLREEFLENGTANQYWVLSVELGDGTIFRAFVQFPTLGYEISVDDLVVGNLSWHLHPVEGAGYFSEM